MGYIRGSERGQHILFPSTLDEYLEEANPVRVIAAFVGVLDFEQLGFVRGKAAATGRPGYDPRLLLGLYIWGHLNKVRSSRKLERESGRNLEAMWLLENLQPDFKTIADFRKDNGEAIKQTVVKFRMWCLSEGLYGREMVAVDGSKFKAVNNSERNFTKKKLAKMIKREQTSVAEYLKAIEAADEEEAKQPPEPPPLSGTQLREKLSKLKERLAQHEQLQEGLKKSGASQVSLTDGDARLMKTSKGSDVCYNVQTVVDSKNKLIAAYQVTNDGNDLGQLANMAKQGQEALGVKAVTVLADGGYFDGNTIKECEEAGITTYLPLPHSKKAASRGMFAAEKFTYHEQQDSYVCPQGEELTFRNKEKARNKEYRIYRTSACGTCPLRAQCTTSKKGRKLRRWVEQAVLERLKERIRGQPELLKERKKLAEHPFGTIKRAMDQGYFLMKGIKKVTTETSLTVLGYNLKRVINIMGAEKMITSMHAVTT